MKISVNISRLKEHIFYLQQEQSEIDILFRILREEERLSSNCRENTLCVIRNMLEKQKNMLSQRADVIETLIEVFSKCIYETSKELQEAKDVLDSLD